MEKKIKQIVSFILILCLMITYVPLENLDFSKVFAAGFQAGATPLNYNSANLKSKKRVNWSAIGYRVSVYYYGTKNGDKTPYSPYIAHKATVTQKTEVPQVVKNTSNKFAYFSSYDAGHDAKSYLASSSKTGYNAANASTTYYRDVAGRKASFLVLDTARANFSEIYAMLPSTDKEYTGSNKGDIYYKLKQKNIIRSSTSASDLPKAYKDLQKFTILDKNRHKVTTTMTAFETMRKGGSYGYRGVKPTSLLQQGELNKLNKWFSYMEKAGGNKADYTEYIKFLKDMKSLPGCNDDYLDMVITDVKLAQANDHGVSSYIQIEPVVVLGYNEKKGVLATWSEARFATKNGAQKGTIRGCFSYRRAIATPMAGALTHKNKTKTTLKSTIGNSKKDYATTYYTKGGYCDNSEVPLALSVLGNLYQKYVSFNNENASADTKQYATAINGYSSRSGVVYYGGSTNKDGGYDASEVTATVNILYDGEVAEDSLISDKGTWQATNAVTEVVLHDNSNTYKTVPSGVITNSNANDLSFSKFIDYENSTIKKKFARLYQWAKKDNKWSVDKEGVSAHDSIAAGKNMNKYTAVAYYNFLVTNNTKKELNIATITNRLDNAVKKQLLAKEDGKNKLNAVWKRYPVSSKEDTNLNAGYKVNFRNFMYQNNGNNYHAFTDVVRQSLLEGDNGLAINAKNYSLSNIIAYPVFDQPDCDHQSVVEVSGTESTDDTLDDAYEAVDIYLRYNNLVFTNKKFARSISNNMLLLGSKKALATQSYYMENLAFENILSSSALGGAGTLNSLKKIAQKKCYALNVLVGAKFGDVTSYYNWAIWDFGTNAFKTNGSISKTYDITSSGYFPLGNYYKDGKLRNINGIKRVVIVPNKGNSGKNSDMAMTSEKLNSIIQSVGSSSTLNTDSTQVANTMHQEVIKALKDQASVYGRGDLRKHYDDKVAQFEQDANAKHDKGDTATVGFYQKEKVQQNTNSDGSTSEDAALNPGDASLDDKLNAEPDTETTLSGSNSSSDELLDAAGSENITLGDIDGYINETFAGYHLRLDKNKFITSLVDFFAKNNIDEVYIVDNNTDEVQLHTIKLADLVKHYDLFDDLCAALDVNKVYSEKLSSEELAALQDFEKTNGSDDSSIDIPDSVYMSLENKTLAESTFKGKIEEGMSTFYYILTQIDKDATYPSFGEADEDFKEFDDFDEFDVPNQDIDSEKDFEEETDTFGKADIADVDASHQRGYTILAYGYVGKPVSTSGIDLQPWELNYVYADLNSAVNASNEGRVDDKNVAYETNAYMSTLSSDSNRELHTKAKIWSYTGSRNACADGHTGITSETYYKPHSGLVSYATVDYVPSAAAWEKDDSLFTYNLIVSDETKPRNGSVDNVKHSNYTYSVNKDKLHADQDNDDTQNHYSLILYSKDLMNSFYGDTNRARYNNTDIRWSTWSRISKNFNNDKYKTHYFTVNSLREAAYFSYVYNLIRYISGDEKVASSIFNYTANENTNIKLKKDSAITEFLKDCLLMKTDNVPNLDVAHLSQSSDKAKKRTRQNKFNVPYYKGETNAKDYISEHITLNAYMQDDDDNINYSTPNNVDINPANENETGNVGSIYHTFKTLMKGHPQSGCNQTIQWTHKVSTTLNVLSSEHCHKETGEWEHWVSTKDGGYWCPHSYKADLSDVPTLCYHNRTIRGVMPDVFMIRSVDKKTGVLGDEESDSQYNLDYGETIYKYITDKMNMGLNNTKTGIIDSNGILTNDGKQDIAVEPSLTANETVESNKPQDGGDNSRIKTQFSSAYFDGEEKGNLSRTAFAFYPEVNMLAYAYGRGQKLVQTTDTKTDAVASYVVPTIGEVERASQGAGLYFMTTKSANYNGAVEKNSQLPNYFNKNGSDFVGTTMSDSVATSTAAQELGNKTSLFNSNKSIKQVIYAGSDVTVSGDANFSLNMYGYALDLISPEDGNDNLLTMQSAITDRYSTYARGYDYIVADNSNIYQKWFDISNGTYKDILAAVKAENPVHNAKDNKTIMTARYNQWVKESINLENWSADYTLNVVGDNNYNSKFTDFSATIGSIRTQDDKTVPADLSTISKQTNVYPLHIKNGEIITTDSGYVAMINQIAMDYFGDTANNVEGVITLTDGQQVAKLKHYDAAEKLFKTSAMGSSVKNAIESSSDNFNKSGSCFSDAEDKTARGNSLLGSIKNWYDEEVRTIVVRRFKTDPLYFKDITASDKIDYNTAPTSETTLDTWKGRKADWYLNLRFKDTDNSGTSTLKKLGVELSKTTTNVNKGFQVVKDLYVDNASFIIPSATTDNMGW